MSDQKQVPQNFRGRKPFFPAEIPSETGELRTWAQSRVSIDRPFRELKLFMDLVNQTRDTMYVAKQAVGGLRGSLPPADQHKSDSLASSDAKAAELRYRYEVARCEFVLARGRFGRALKLLCGHLQSTGMKVDVPADCSPADRLLYQHDLLCAAQLVQRSVAELKSINAYLDDLPSFSCEVESAFQHGRLDYKAFNHAVIAEAEAAGCDWTQLGGKVQTAPGGRKPNRFIEALRRELIE